MVRSLEKKTNVSVKWYTNESTTGGRQQRIPEHLKRFFEKPRENSIVRCTIFFYSAILVAERQWCRKESYSDRKPGLLLWDPNFALPYGRASRHKQHSQSFSSDRDVEGRGGSEQRREVSTSRWLSVEML
ncbi:hypothetical protein JAAARDRAFT_439464, partial [Jaapia argillacea MUCL 33604]